MQGSHTVPDRLRAQIEAGGAPPILDVRSAAEFRRGHVPGARHVPFWAILWRARRLSLSRDAPLVVYCGHGPRAYVAGALLRLRGFAGVTLLRGHMAGWRREGHPEGRP